MDTADALPPEACSLLYQWLAPRTLKIRPRVFSLNRNADRRASCYCLSMPRTSPSVLPWRCSGQYRHPDACLTSAVNVVPSCVLMRIASLIFGSLPWLNLISRTATEICVTLAYILFCHVVSPLLITVQNLPSYLFFPISVPNLYTSSHKCLSKTFMPL